MNLIKLLFAGLLLVITTSTATAQNFTLSGYLRDAKTGEELLNATVYVEGSSQGSVTNLYGFYSLTLPQGTYQINYSYLGYETKTVKINLTEDTNKDVELSPSINQLEEVVITSTAYLHVIII